MIDNIKTHEKFMAMAMKEALKAEEKGEVPIGCVIVKDGKVIARGRNMREEKMDATLHAEMIAIRKACKKLKDWRLCGCDIYVTLEPCPMCAGAIVNARLDNLFFGAYDKVSGCAETVYNICNTVEFYHKLPSYGGILEENCSKMLVNFFKRRRKENKLKK